MLAACFQQCLELSEGVLDRIEVWAVGRQEQQLRADGSGRRDGFVRPRAPTYFKRDPAAHEEPPQAR
jgi:hypothetical protein